MADGYHCQTYDINRMCRYDRRAIDSKCNGCPRTTDTEYLIENGLMAPPVVPDAEEVSR